MNVAMPTEPFPRLSQQQIFDHNRSFYEPLNPYHDPPLLRVFQIEPGDFSDPIKGRLLVTSSSWTALSYSWGSTKYHRTITVNGRPGFIVTANAFAAIRRLRRPIGQSGNEIDTLLIWIDAISMNQADAKEKTMTVRRMPEIYSTAVSVFVWLGPCHSIALGDDEHETCSTHRDSNSFGVRVKDLLGKHTPYFSEEISMDTSQMVVAYLDEAILATSLTILVGPHRYDWDSYYKSIHIHDLLPHPIKHRMIEVATYREASRLHGITTWELSNLLVMSAPYSSSDSRDKKHGHNFVADYEATPEEAACEATYHIMVFEDRGLDQLHSQWPRLRGSVGSWACDFLKTYTLPSADGKGREPREGTFNQWDNDHLPDWPDHESGMKACSASSDALMAISLDGTTLCAKGLRLGTVVRSVHCAPASSDAGFLLIFSTAQSYGFEGEAETVFCASEHDVVRALRQRFENVGHHGDLLLEPAAAYHLTPTTPSHFPRLDFITSRLKRSPPTVLRHDWQHYAHQIMTKHRVLFQTVVGHVGLSRMTSEPGDVVAVLFGAKLPVLLRPVSSQRKGNRGFMFLCEVYVFDIMKGQLVEMSRKLGGDVLRGEEVFRLI
ncbi:hypothetical protein LTR56_015003 [Elasticomyces elasticus]|nr:hypothetical protein LTR56_015003 [Elasticomyces elasticus]KAK3646967.1 hypothetical protein LTR22_013994 [Elasticomyces elasticus]